MSANVTVPVRFDGGDGNDGLFGGGGTDEFLGGAGNDNVVSRDGRGEQVDCGREPTLRSATTPTRGPPARRSRATRTATGSAGPPTATTRTRRSGRVRRTFRTTGSTRTARVRTRRISTRMATARRARRTATTRIPRSGRARESAPETGSTRTATRAPVPFLGLGGRAAQRLVPVRTADCQPHPDRPRVPARYADRAALQRARLPLREGGPAGDEPAARQPAPAPRRTAGSSAGSSRCA